MLAHQIGDCIRYLLQLDNGNDCANVPATPAAQRSYSTVHHACHTLDESRVHLCPPGWSEYNCTLSFTDVDADNCVLHLSSGWAMSQPIPVYLAQNRDARYIEEHGNGTLIVGGGTAKYGRWEDILEGWAPAPVITRGFGGSCLSDIVFLFSQLVLPLRPRVLVVMGYSDLGRYQDRLKITLTSWKETVLALAGSCRSAGIRLVVMGLKPYPAKSTLKTNRLSASGWLRIGDVPNQHTHDRSKPNGLYPSANAWLAQQCVLVHGDWGVPLVAAKAAENLYLSDNMHLSNLGYNLITPVIRDAVKRAADSAWDPSC